MDEQEREYLIENARRMRQLEETPTAPSGRCSDMTDVEKEKLIDYLFDQNEKLNVQLAGVREELRLQREQSAERHRSLASQMERMEERAVAAEKRAELAEKRANKESEMRAESDKRIAELSAALTAIIDGSVINDLKEQIVKVEKERDDAKAADRQNRGERYGSKSQRMKKSDKSDDNGDADGNNRDAGEEKSNMGGKESVKPLPDNQPSDDSVDPWVHDHYDKPRPNRQGQSNNKMEAKEMIHHRSDETGLPEGWKIVGHYERDVFEKITKIVGHRVYFLFCEDKDGNLKIVYQPVGKHGKRWVRNATDKLDAIHQVKYGPVLDEEGEPIVDCVPGTSATAEMLAQLTVDHYLNNVPYNRLSNYYKDCGLRQVRQSLINWIGRAGEPLAKLIPLMLDKAVTKDAVVNCDETWCKVRVNGKYNKRYTWCLVNKEAKIVIYCYKKGARSRKALQDILQDRLPMAMQTDGYNVYMYLDDVLIDTEHICCMAHARAKFYKAWITNKDLDAKYILDLIWELYELERHYLKQRLSPEEIQQRRNDEKTSEIIIKLRSKLDAMKADGHPPMSELLEKAVDYIDSFWKQIMAYRNNGKYSIDNNIAERFMKPLVNERKNSYFYGSDRMANVSAVYYTLISTCKLMKVSVTEYFSKVFAKIVRGCTDYASLLPMNMGLSINKY